MLLEEFDKNKKAVINPDTFHSKIPGFPKTCLSFFSKSIMKEITENMELELIGKVSNATANFPIYKTTINGQEIAIYQSPVGAPACVSNYEEIIAMGIENMLLVGCCGCLENEIEEYSIIIPTSAIRDEGTSYHYESPKDETVINENMIQLIENIMISNKINYKKGKTWTTDAIFRETKDKVERRKKQGAITVDMECSAMDVVSKYRNVNFGQFFYAADNLGAEQYDPRNNMTGKGISSEKRKVISIALECATLIDKTYNK